MLSNAYFLAKFRFDTAENEPAKNLQNFRKMHFRKMQCLMHFRKMHFRKMHFPQVLELQRGPPRRRPLVRRPGRGAGAGRGDRESRLVRLR